ncbi:MAG: DUF4450 domain-containing protein [Chitinophagaceae bacterium]
MQKILILTICCLTLATVAPAQPSDTTRYWHGIERSVRYEPDGTDFVITNGNRRFTRALYGTNTAFRVEAGDLPEFAIYMPGMGGNFKMGLISGDSSKWLIDAKKITARYRPGSMIYDIEDNLLGKGTLHLVVLAMADAEGMIIRAHFENVAGPVQLFWAFGGASGKKFSRDGDMGPDPESSFYLKPEYCTDNRYSINKNNFSLSYGSGLVAEWDPYVNKTFASDTVKAVKIGKEQMLSGIVPASSDIRVVDAGAQSVPNALYQSAQSKSPAICGELPVKNNESYFFAVQKPETGKSLVYAELPLTFNKAETARKLIAERIKIVTPDKWINTLGGVLGIAADAIWESPTYMHGSIGWRMRLNGWRGPYVADVLGWHDRAHEHFKAYSLSQVTSPLTGPVVMDTALHLARSLEKMGTSVYSSGYISRNPGGDFRPHHYDMNLVYIDALIRHFYWTGDLAFAKEMWPVITRHLAWEKRNFDSDNDGLYDAYAAIWASDALQYSGGAVTHTSAYNYMANREAAVIAKLIGEDGNVYEAEAAKIHAAINKTLWMPTSGNYAEFKDLLGNKMLHENPAVWTIYHSLDSEVPDPFQAYQSMKYVDDKIPHIPVRAKGMESGYSTISTSRWMPYDWSLNNVATAEVMHTSLAYWQAGRSEKAFNLWKSELLSTMYLGGSPGNIGQISFYDAARGEAYRDFADPVAMTSRSLVEGLFGIHPNALKGELTIKPGFPAAWNSAAISTPDIVFNFRRNGMKDSYSITPTLPKATRLKLSLQANGTAIKSLLVNGKKYPWKNVEEAIGSPVIDVEIPSMKTYRVEIVWNGIKPDSIVTQKVFLRDGYFKVRLDNAVITDLRDPQTVFLSPLSPLVPSKAFTGRLRNIVGKHTVFFKVKQNDVSWWQPVDFMVKDQVELVASAKQSKDGLSYSLVNNTDADLAIDIAPYNGDYDMLRTLKPGSNASPGSLPALQQPGTNVISVTNRSHDQSSNEVLFSIVNWNAVAPAGIHFEPIDISGFFNDKVTNIFKNQYRSPRPPGPTLQLPTQGIGDWTHPLKTAEINDKGLRQLAGKKGEITLPQGITFKTPTDTLQPNIVFTSQWDNYPKEVSIPLTGKASHAYFMMAGSTNPMQSRIVNGAVIISYTDGTGDTLWLKNPETWWPIEQDYMDDGYAFQINAPRPPRIHLKTGKIVSAMNDDESKRYGGKMIDGGAATVLDLPLNITKTLKSISVKAIANDVVIGLMSVSLVR